MDNMLDHLDELNMHMNALEAKNAKLRETFVEKGDSHSDIKMRYEYL